MSANFGERGITPHVAAKQNRGNVDGRTTHTAGYAISQLKRKRVEEPFGWMKTVGSLRRTAYRGLQKNLTLMLLNSTAFNITRLAAY